MHSEDIGEASDRAAAFARFAVGDGFDIAFGGGADDFTAEDLDALSDGGATVEMSWSSSAAGLDERLVRLIASGDLDSASERFSSGSDQPTLEEMTRVAIESLDKGGDDFLLVVHAAGLGDRLSAMDRTASLVDEVVDLDGAVKAALAYAAGRDDTVVIVLGLRDSTLSVIDNHYGFHKKQCGVAVRCGGDELFIDLPVAVGDVQNGDGLDDVALQGDFTPSRALLQYGWLPYTAHLDNDGAGSGSANFTPLFAAGAGAELLAGFHQHADVGSVLANWLTD